MGTLDLWRALSGVVALAVAVVLLVSPAVAQGPDDLTGDWQSAGGEVRFQLNIDETYTLLGAPGAEVERLSGVYRYLPDDGFMLVRAAEISGGFRIDVVSIGDELVLSNDDLLGGEMTFVKPYRLKDFLGADVGVFIGLTLIVFGGAALMTGQAMANGWHSYAMAAGYSVLLGAADRFMVHWLFDGPLLDPWGFVVHTLILMAITMIAYRITRARLMVSQYPWRFQRSGLFGWRDREGGQA